MFDASRFVPKDQDLANAGGLLLIEIAAFATISLFLSAYGMNAESLLFVGLLMFNVAPAYFLYRAARKKAKSGLIFGLLSLVPAGAIFSFFLLRNDELFD